MVTWLDINSDCKIGGKGHSGSRAKEVFLGFVCGLLLFCGVFWGCPGQLENPDSFLGEIDRCEAITFATFQNSCLGGGCHGAAAPAANLDLDSEGLAARLSAQNAVSSGCEDLKMIDPQNPTESFLYIKMTASPRCASIMPLGAAQIGGADLDCIAQWIAGLGEGQ